MEVKKIAEEIIKESALGWKDSGMGFVDNMLQGGADTHINRLSSIFNKWAMDTKRNFSDVEAQEWGARNIKDAIETAKKDLAIYLYNKL